MEPKSNSFLPYDKVLYYLTILAHTTIPFRYSITCSETSLSYDAILPIVLPYDTSPHYDTILPYDTLLPYDIILS